MNRRDLLTGSLAAWLAFPRTSLYARGFVQGASSPPTGAVGPSALLSDVRGLPSDGILATVEPVHPLGVALPVGAMREISAREVLAPLFLQDPEALFGALEQTIRRELVRREAIALEVFVKEKVLEAGVDAYIKKQQDAFGLKFHGLDFAKYMKDNFGTSPAEYRAILRDVALENLLLERVVRYSAMRFERIQLRCIFVYELQKAKDLLEKLKDGANFGALAKAESVDEHTAPNFGLMPPVPTSSGGNELIRVGSQLKEGEISGIGHDEQGKKSVYWIAKLEKRFPASREPYAAVADQIDAEFEKSEIDVFELLTWDEEVRTRYKIDVRLGR